MEDSRLEDLQKQKALIEEHLDWLNAQIESLQGAASPMAKDPSPSRLGSQELSTQEVFVPGSSPVTDPDPETVIPDLYDELGPDTKASVKDARKGCLAIFAAAFLALGLLAAWVWIKY